MMIYKIWIVKFKNIMDKTIGLPSSLVWYIFLFHPVTYEYKLQRMQSPTERVQCTLEKNKLKQAVWKNCQQFDHA